MTKLRVGVIGAGAISSSHCAGAQAHPDAEVVAIADHSRLRAKRKSDEFEIPKIYERIEDLIADKDLDAVSIGLPNYLHAPTAIAALEAGKHVMLDKPFALNLGEAEEVVETARKNGLVLMVGMNLRFGENVQTVRTLVERGDLGEVYHAKAYMMRRAGIPKKQTWFCRKDQAGGGCLLDIGVHVIDMALYMMDNFHPASVSGAVYTKFGHRGLGEGGWGESDRDPNAPPFDVDDMATAQIKLEDGATLELNVSWACHEREPRSNVELFGTDAGAAINPTSLFRDSDVEGEYEVVEPQGVPLKISHGHRSVNWIDAILGKAEQECTIEQALAVQKIIDAVYESSSTGKEVRIK